MFHHLFLNKHARYLSAPNNQHQHIASYNHRLITVDALTLEDDVLKRIVAEPRVED